MDFLSYLLIEPEHKDSQSCILAAGAVHSEVLFYGEFWSVGRV